MRRAGEIHYFHGERIPVPIEELPPQWRQHFGDDEILRDSNSHILATSDVAGRRHEVRFTFDDEKNVRVIYPGGAVGDELWSIPISPDDGRNKIDDMLANFFGIY